jgi:hypothetical protein
VQPGRPLTPPPGDPPDERHRRAAANNTIEFTLRAVTDQACRAMPDGGVALSWTAWTRRSTRPTPSSWPPRADLGSPRRQVTGCEASTSTRSTRQGRRITGRPPAGGQDIIVDLCEVTRWISAFDINCPEHPVWSRQHRCPGHTLMDVRASRGFFGAARGPEGCGPTVRAVARIDDRAGMSTSVSAFHSSMGGPSRSLRRRSCHCSRPPRCCRSHRPTLHLSHQGLDYRCSDPPSGRPGGHHTPAVADPAGRRFRRCARL